MDLDLGPLEDLLKRAIAEDLGGGDITTDALVPEGRRAGATFVARQDAVVAGLPVAEKVMLMLSEAVRFQPFVSDGDRVSSGQALARVEGPARAILKAERLALNILQWLSGIATLTRQCVEAVGGQRVRIMDTRKTTPCWRTLEKYAVRKGGGTNHRSGLYDQVLIKDNHLRVLPDRPGGKIALAVSLARSYAGPATKVEVEADTMDEALDAARAGADIVMLDNMSFEELSEAVGRLRALTEGEKRIEVEVSGGIGLRDIPAAARTGADRISIGAVTHSAPAADITLQFD